MKIKDQLVATGETRSLGSSPMDKVIENAAKAIGRSEAYGNVAAEIGALAREEIARGARNGYGEALNDVLTRLQLLRESNHETAG